MTVTQENILQERRISSLPEHDATNAPPSWCAGDDKVNDMRRGSRAPITARFLNGEPVAIDASTHSPFTVLHCKAHLANYLATEKTHPLHQRAQVVSVDGRSAPSKEVAISGHRRATVYIPYVCILGDMGSHVLEDDHVLAEADEVIVVVINKPDGFMNLAQCWHSVIYKHSLAEDVVGLQRAFYTLTNERTRLSEEWLVIVHNVLLELLRDSSASVRALTSLDRAVGGLNVNFRDEEGNTLLMNAVAYDQHEKASWLIERKARVNAANQFGHTALACAARDGRRELVNILIKAGVLVNQSDNFGLTPVFLAAREGHADILDDLVAQDCDVNKASRPGSTPLIVAIKNARSEICRRLIRAKCNVNKGITAGWTPLTLAANQGKEDICALLIEGNADVNCFGDRGMRLRMDSALMCAVEKGHAGIVERLIAATCDVNRQLEHTKSSALHVAAENGHYAIAVHLIDAKSRLDAKDNQNWTPLMNAIQNKHNDIAVKLLDSGCDVENPCGWSPLLVAIKVSNVAMVKELVTRGVDVNYEHPGTHQTAIQLAYQNGSMELISLLHDAVKIL